MAIWEAFYSRAEQDNIDRGDSDVGVNIFIRHLYIGKAIKGMIKGGDRK